MTTMTQNITNVHQVYIRATAEQIWEAITKPEFTLKYFYGTRVESDLTVGSPFVFRAGDSDELLVDGEVLESDPPKRLSVSWRFLYEPELAAEEPSRVTWEIEPQEGGYCKFTAVHEGLGEKAAEQVSGGWPYIVSGLKTLLETGKPLAG
jgi:uncharacterized protein YndB with AHSA1/START domain